MGTPYVAVVIPAYDEEERILRTLQRLHEYFSEQDYSWSVNVVSDGSKDKTEEIVQAFASEHPEFRLLAYKPNHGKGYAVRHGMLNVEGELLLINDADLATPIEEIEKLLPAIKAGKDIAIGSRPLKESNLEIRQPWHREQLGRMFNRAVQLLAVRGIEDTQCGFKLFKKPVAVDIFKRCDFDGFSYDFEALLIARELGYSIAEIPIRWRHQDGSKVNPVRDGIRMLRDLVKLRLKGKKGRLRERES